MFLSVTQCRMSVISTLPLCLAALPPHKEIVNICPCFSGQCWVLKLALKRNARLFLSSCNPGGQSRSGFTIVPVTLFVVFPQTGWGTYVNCPFSVHAAGLSTVRGHLVCSSEAGNTPSAHFILKAVVVDADGCPTLLCV